ncbi:MAG TPA: 4Fe-4S ferredoxin, partial [Anaeromyxobacteraceae bacterium]|nr:4Fe-4S ferredoxin [Anaeromyxobacteraceae bacterium]
MPSLGLPIYGQTPPASAGRWRSLAERDGTADPAAGSYPDGDQPPPDSFGRRGFMQLLGASTALAGLAACQPPREQVVSYVRRPAGVTPSLPQHFATAASRGGHAVGLVVESHEGRPTKIEGNPDHPANVGGAGLQELAAILDLYDPNRLAGVRRKGAPLAWSAWLREASARAAALEKDGGARLRVLAEPTSSPTLALLRQRLLARFPRARVDAWDPLAEDAARAGARLAFGRPLEPVYDLAQADVVVALDADLLAGEGDHLRHARDFASRRTQAGMNRLYAVEAGYSVTGGAADHRLRVRASEVLAFGRGLARALASSHGLAALAPVGGPVPERWKREIAAIARDLARAGGKALVVAGARQPAALHALAAAVNVALGAAGRTVTWREPALLDAEAGPSRLAALAREIEAGQVETLLVTAWNPVFTAPADLGLAALLARVPEVVYLAAREDETTRVAGTVVARSHALESWGDLRGRDGTASIVQPLLAPLFESVTEADLLAAFVEQGHLGSWR